MLLKLKNLQYAKKQTLCLCVTGVSLNRTEQILKKKNVNYQIKIIWIHIFQWRKFAKTFSSWEMMDVRLFWKAFDLLLSSSSSRLGHGQENGVLATAWDSDHLFARQLLAKHHGGDEGIVIALVRKLKFEKLSPLNFFYWKLDKKITVC